MLKISSKSSSIVKPAELTWSGKLPLSELDQTGSMGHTPIFYFYTKSPNEWTTMLNALKSSLSCALVYFYPLAGRLSPAVGGRLELDCNAAGVQFVEAYADKKLTDVDINLPSPIYHQLLPSTDYHNTPHEEIPLLVLQVTRFICGGFCLGFSTSHVVTDGQSALHFLCEWARICRGELLESPPYLDRRLLQARNPPRASSRFKHEESNAAPILIDQSDNESEHEKETTVRMLKLTATQVEKLRKKANNSWKSDLSHGFTRYEVVSAHVWRTLCNVRNHKPEQQTALAITIDVRSKMRPPLPREYFGNAIVTEIATGRSSDIVSKPLGYSTSKIRDVIKKVDDEHVNSLIDFLKGQEDVSNFQDLKLNNPNVSVTSWLTLPINGLDFGWGKEVLITPGSTHDVDGDYLILHGEDGDGSLVVALCLKVRHMEDFQKLFYQDIDMEYGMMSKLTKRLVAKY